jgi:hypothetical protein
MTATVLRLIVGEHARTARPRLSRQGGGVCIHGSPSRAVLRGLPGRADQAPRAPGVWGHHYSGGVCGNKERFGNDGAGR